ncbi:MAG: efflux RND transporter periplasmic adaptor subunit [Desulfobacteraceae bacterium]
MPVSIEVVEPRPMRDILVLPGQTEAWQDVLVPSDTLGRVEWIGPKEGDSVEKGDLLAKVDVSSLKAALDRAEAAFNLAEEVYQRRLRLHKKALIAQEDLDRARTERNLAEGDLRQARVEYERGFIRAPISGAVNELFVDRGEFIGRGDPLAELVNVDRIKMNVDVPEMDVRYMEKGRDVEVRIDAFPDRRLSGKVGFVAFKADPAAKTFKIQVLVENPDGEIRPGMIGRVAFLRRVVPEALTAPLFAVLDKGGERVVYVEEDGTAHARTVSLGVIDGDRVQITQGLSPGDRLIIRGHTEVEEGMRVEVR